MSYTRYSTEWLTSHSSRDRFRVRPDCRHAALMKKSVPADSPDAYVAALTGWRKVLVESLRRSALAAGKLEERIKWGHLVYSFNGPVLLIRAEETRVLFGFWRGKRLANVDRRLKPSGRYELANMVLVEGDEVSPARARSLVEAAIELNQQLGDPRVAAKVPQATNS